VRLWPAVAGRAGLVEGVGALGGLPRGGWLLDEFDVAPVDGLVVAFVVECPVFGGDVVACFVLAAAGATPEVVVCAVPVGVAVRADVPVAFWAAPVDADGVGVGRGLDGRLGVVRF